MVNLKIYYHLSKEGIENDGYVLSFMYCIGNEYKEINLTYNETEEISNIYNQIKKRLENKDKSTNGLSICRYGEKNE